MDKKRINFLQEMLIILTMVLGIDWIRMIFLWINNWYLLSKGRYLPFSQYLYIASIGTLWVALFIYYICILKRDGKGKKLKSIRNKLVVIPFVFLLQSSPWISGIFGKKILNISSEFIWKYEWLVFFSHLLFLVIIWTVLMIYYFITKKKLIGREEKNENFHSVRDKLAVTIFVVVLQWIAWIFDIYGGMLMVLGYPVFFVIIWVVFLIYYFNKR